MTYRERVIAHGDKFTPEQMEIVNGWNEIQAKVAVSYWDSNIPYEPHQRTLEFLGIQGNDEMIRQLFKNGLK